MKEKTKSTIIIFAVFLNIIILIQLFAFLRYNVEGAWYWIPYIISSVWLFFYIDKYYDKGVKEK